MTERKLRRPPIVEAVIDLRVEQRPELEFDELKAIHPLLGVEVFPKADTQQSFSIPLREGGANPIDVQSTGLVFKSADNLHVVQAQRDGFAFSRLAPYDCWEDLVKATRLHWKMYTDVARPLSITRLAVRYINRIELPEPIGDFNDWLPEFPRVPAALPQGIGSMVLRMVIPIDAEGATVILGQTFDPTSTTPTHLPVIFDIDVYAPVAMPIEGQPIWDALESLRSIKNDFFFEYLSPKTLELYR